MENYPANSKASKPDPKNIEQVTTGKVMRKKKGLGKRFHEVFIGGDANNVWNYIAFDILIPAAKDTVSDAISQGIDRMLFGESNRYAQRRRGSRGGGNSGYVSYNRYAPTTTRPMHRYDQRDDRRQLSTRSRATHDFDDIILETRVEAEEVLERMFDLINRYEVVTVSDFYDLVGITGNFTDEKYGWTDIRGAGVTRVKQGYLLDLPRPESLD
jgi:hypothetical protein